MSRHRTAIATRLLVVAVGLGFAPRATTVGFGDPELALMAGRAEVGDLLRIEEVPVGPDGTPVTLELERFRVFTPGARIVVHSPAGVESMGPRPRAYFKGIVEGDPTSLAVLSLAEARWRGWIATNGRWYSVGSPDGDTTISLHTEDLTGETEGDSFCAVDRLGEPASDLRRLFGRTEPGKAPPAASAAGPVYAADLAIDTDWEFFSLFGTVETATDYATDLVAAASAIYERDVSTRLQMSLLILWTTPRDPYEVEGDLLEALYELGDHWHADHGGTERTLAHLLSGKTSLAGGIAYGGVLCSPDIFTNGHWAGGYGLSGSMTSFGSFRDVFVFSHELGHNFDSRHTHCYNGVPLPGDPEVDQCRTGETTGGGHVCYAGPENLPTGGGSIMSYCHLQPGGYGNINLWLGREGFYGVESERVPAQMTQHIEEVAACLPDSATIFGDGFESGDTAAWSTTIP